jgi:hypothetical protein
VHFADLRESSRKDTEARAATLEKKRANLRVVRAAQARSGKKAKSQSGLLAADRGRG